MKRIILTLIFMMGLTMCWGQETVSDSTSKKKDEHSLSIYFEVKDYLSNIGVDTMTVLVLNAADSVFVDSAHVDLYKHDDERYSSAYFDLKKTGDYLIRVDAEGYKTRFVPFSIKRFHKHEIYRQLKPVYLQRLPKKKTSTFLDGNMLDEIVVKASKVKFYHDGDTLVFDADAFEMAEGSMLDALIKQLPGVELKSGGEITVNGRKVEELLLNAKDLKRFGQDLCDEINAKLKEAGRPAKLTLGKKPADIDGGLKLKDGSIETNCSVSTLIAASKDALVPQVAAMLFG